MILEVAEPPELWTFLAFNLIILVFGGVLTTFSYLTYIRTSSDQFRRATFGFALVTSGGLVEPIYEVGIKGSYQLTSRELLAIQSVEGLLIGCGLGALFYSIYSFTPAGSRRSTSDNRDDSHDVEQRWQP